MSAEAHQFVGVEPDWLCPRCGRRAVEELEGQRRSHLTSIPESHIYVKLSDIAAAVGKSKRWLEYRRQEGRFRTVTVAGSPRVELAEACRFIESLVVK